MLQKGALEPMDLLGPGFYSQLFLVERLRGVATRHRSVGTEWLRHSDEVPHGDSGISFRVDQEGELDVLHRPERHLLPDSCPSGISAVSSLLSWRMDLSVPCIVLRSVCGPAGVYQSFCSGFGVGALEGHASAPLPG